MPNCGTFKKSCNSGSCKVSKTKVKTCKTSTKKPLHKKNTSNKQSHRGGVTSKTSACAAKKCIPQKKSKCYSRMCDDYSSCSSSDDSSHSSDCSCSDCYSSSDSESSSYSSDEGCCRCPPRGCCRK